MSWRRLTFKHSVRNVHRYVNYVTASAFAVMVFYLLSAFVLNPGVKQGAMATTAKELMLGCQYIVIGFAVFFIFFFHNGLLRLRSKEFGLLLTLGVTPKQIGRMIFGESLCLGGVAISAGILLGVLFSRLFLLALGAILSLPELPFVVPAASVTTTILFFGVLFICEAAWTSLRTGLRSPKLLLLGQRTQQKAPRFSMWWVSLGLVCLSAGYGLAITQSRNFVIDMFPILILTSVGTYLLFSQILVMVLTFLRRKSLSGISLLVVSRFAYRVKDNARVLTVVTIVTAIVLTGMGSVFGIRQTLGQNALRVEPYSIMIAKNQVAPVELSVQQIHQVLRDNHLPLVSEASASILVGQIQTVTGQWVSVQVMSFSTFTQLRNELHKGQPSLRQYLPSLTSTHPGHADLLVPYPMVVANRLTHTTSAIRLGETSHAPLIIDSQQDIRVVNQRSTALPDYELVVSDLDFTHWTALAPASTHWALSGIIVSNWEHSQKAVDQLNSLIPVAQQKYMSSTVATYGLTQQTLSVMLFTGFFISMLFFLAAGGSIYFRLDSQQEEDRRQFRVLQRMGMTRKEIGRVLTAELVLLFYLPVALALVHSACAIIDLGHLVPLYGGGWTILCSVAGIYCLFTLVYFWLSKVRHLRRVTTAQALPGSLHADAEKVPN